jgi:nudix-type nucleoside diphosphatase (YffH/AdpP family)
VTEDHIRRMKVELKDVSLEYDGFFKLKSLSTIHELYDGPMRPFKWLVFERGNSVAVVLYKRDSQEIILTRQFRAPTLRYRKIDDHYELNNDGQLDETIAGMPRAGEDYRDCAVREVKEEAGYIITRSKLEQIAQYYVSPGGTSEQIILFYAEVTDADRDPKRNQQTGGVSSDAESILVRHIPVSQFFSTMLHPEEIIDGKLLIASLILKDRLGKLPDAATQPAPVARRQYQIRFKPDCTLVLRTGNMLSITDVDAWINSENTDMEMDRFIGRSVSALIRHAGAAKDANGRVIEDTIGDALKAKMRGRRTSHIGTVHDTTPGELTTTHNVRRIFHVVAVYGVVGKGSYAHADLIEEVSRKVLEAVEKRNHNFVNSRCRTALLPMIGTGDSGLAPAVAFPKIIDGIISFFQAQRSPVLRAVHMSAFRQNDADVATQFLDAHSELIAA